MLGHLRPPSQLEAEMGTNSVGGPAPPKLFAMADSAPLFRGSWWPDVVGSSVDHAVDCCQRAREARYIGASNGDAEEFYELFVHAAARLGFAPRQCHHVVATAATGESAEAKAHCRCVAQETALVLLAGGNTATGWHAMDRYGLVDAILTAHAGGAVLVGISAGAIQLGTHGYLEAPQISNADVDGYGVGAAKQQAVANSAPFPTLGLVPFIFGAHEEAAGWPDVLAALDALALVNPTLAVRCRAH